MCSIACYSNLCMVMITIPKRMAREDDLVVISKKKLDALIARTNNSVTERDVLRWSREAKKQRRTGKLTKL